MRGFKNFGNIQWPYRITPERAFRKGVVAISGMVIGAKLVTAYFKPMEVSPVWFLPYFLFFRTSAKSWIRERWSYY
jgi:hypothetical protein